MTKAAVTPAEAFEMLSISRTTGYAMLKDGRLRSVRIGPHKIIVPVTEIERLLAPEQEAA
jgi:excisionase family DNA binding protein